MKRMKYDEVLVGTTGELGETPNVKHLEWKIRAFFSLSAKKGDYYKSETFYFLNKYWHLRIFPGGCEGSGEGCCSLFLVQESPGEVCDVIFSLGFREEDGQFNDIKKSIVFTTPFSGMGDFFSRVNLFEQKSEYMPSDVLTIMCVIWQVQSVKTSGIELVDLHPLSKNMEALLTSSNNFDTTLNVKGKQFQAHRSLLAARSSVFAAMFDHGMSENVTGIVDIVDCDEEAFAIFLKYLYTGRVSIMSLASALNLYFIAVKYEVLELRMFCVQNMVKNLNVENFTEVVLCAEQYDEAELLSAVQYFFNGNLKDIVLTEKWDALLKDNPCMGNKLLVGMSKELPDDGLPNEVVEDRMSDEVSDDD